MVGALRDETQGGGGEGGVVESVMVKWDFPGVFRPRHKGKDGCLRSHGESSHWALLHSSYSENSPSA